MKKQKVAAVIVSVAGIVGVGLALAQPPTGPMSFFLASRGSGNGGNLGGLEGADRICQDLAQAAGHGARTWRAYLSTQGPNAVHALNPTIFLALLLLAIAYQARVFGDRWRALVGGTLIVLCPTFLHLWALTLVRDLATHLAGIFGLFLLLPRARGEAPSAWRTAAAGLSIGYAGSIRPDAIVYVVPALSVATPSGLSSPPPATGGTIGVPSGPSTATVSLPFPVTKTVPPVPSARPNGLTIPRSVSCRADPGSPPG